MAAQAAPPLADLKLLGGNLALDFANTVDPRTGDNAVDYLHNYPDLVRWGARAGALSDLDAHRLLTEARRNPEGAAGRFREAIALREAIFHVFAAVAHGETSADRDLETVTRHYRQAMEHMRIIPRTDGYTMVPDPDDGSLERVVWPVARAAVELLTQGDLHRIKSCPGADGCDWLFLDTSKNASRKWCSMEGCGSRVKMRRQYRRNRQAQREP